MKKTILLTAILFGFFSSNLKAYDYHGNVRVDYFFPALERYGEWIDIGYDDYVWRPYNTYRDWRPYTEGRWEWTNNGWYWVSYEPFGWATYHYGRWFFDDYYGWVWMPDSEWGPSWVEWRYDDNYIGWAPLPPYARYHRNHGISFSIKWNSGYFYWNFVKYNYFVSNDIHNHYIFGNNAERIYKRTKYRTNYYSNNDKIINGGINREFVEKRSGKKITTREINISDRTYDSKELKNSREIREFKPNENEMNRENSFDRANVTKGRELKNLRTDKVVISKNSADKKSEERTIERKTETRVESKENKSFDKSRSTDKKYDEKVMNRSKDVEIKNSENKNVERREINKSNSVKEAEKSLNKNTERTKRSIEIKSEPKKEVKRNTETNRNTSGNAEKSVERKTVKSRK